MLFYTRVSGFKKEYSLLKIVFYKAENDILLYIVCELFNLINMMIIIASRLKKH